MTYALTSTWTFATPYTKSRKCVLPTLSSSHHPAASQQQLHNSGSFTAASQQQLHNSGSFTAALQPPSNLASPRRPNVHLAFHILSSFLKIDKGIHMFLPKRF